MYFKMEIYLSKLIKKLNLIKIVKYRVQILYSLYALEKLAYFACWLYIIPTLWNYL